MSNAVGGLLLVALALLLLSIVPGTLLGLGFRRHKRLGLIDRGFRTGYLAGLLVSFFFVQVALVVLHLAAPHLEWLAALAVLPANGYGLRMLWSPRRRLPGETVRSASTSPYAPLPPVPQP